MINHVEAPAAVAGTSYIHSQSAGSGDRSSPGVPDLSHVAEIGHKIGQSIEYMRSHLNQPLQISTLAVVAGISASHLFASFKRLTGHAPIEYFTDMRMRCACDLLEETSLSVKEVAATLGYDDQFYFSRVFKLATQIPPTRYRRLDDSARSSIKDSLTPAPTIYPETGKARGPADTNCRENRLYPALKTEVH